MRIPSSDSAQALGARDRVSLCEALDRVLNKGAVVAGELTISVADIDLIYLALQLVVTSTSRTSSRGARPPACAREGAHGVH